MIERQTEENREKQQIKNILMQHKVSVDSENRITVISPEMMEAVYSAIEKKVWEEAAWWSAKSVQLLKTALDKDPVFDYHNKEAADRLKVLQDNQAKGNDV